MLHMYDMVIKKYIQEIVRFTITNSATTCI